MSSSVMSLTNSVSMNHSALPTGLEQAFSHAWCWYSRKTCAVPIRVPSAQADRQRLPLRRLPLVEGRQRAGLIGVPLGGERVEPHHFEAVDPLAVAARLARDEHAPAAGHPACEFDVADV